MCVMAEAITMRAHWWWRLQRVFVQHWSLCIQQASWLHLMIPIFSRCFFCYEFTSFYVTLIFHVFPYVFGESSLLLSSSWLYMFNSNQTTTAKDELCFIGLSRYIFPLWRFCFHLAIILLCNVIICSFFSLQNVYGFFCDADFSAFIHHVNAVTLIINAQRSLFFITHS